MHARTEIIGHLGRDPEMRYTPAGQAVTQFSVAVSHKYTSSTGEKVEVTTWYQVQAWGKRGEVCNQYLKKGARVYISGRLVPDKKTGGPRVWERKDGSWGASFELNAEIVLFLDRKGEAFAGDQGPEHSEEDAPEARLDAEDLPF